MAIQEVQMALSIITDFYDKHKMVKESAAGEGSKLWQC
jgi:hypothetical protein